MIRGFQTKLQKWWKKTFDMFICKQQYAPEAAFFRRINYSVT